MFRYLKGFASHVMEKQRFSISKSRQKYSNVHRATPKLSRKKKKSVFFLKPYGDIYQGVKCSDVTFFTSIILLGLLDTPASKWSFKSERTLPFPAASTHNFLLFKESLLICRTGKQNTNQPKKKTPTNHKPKQRPTLHPSNTRKHHPCAFRSTNLLLSISYHNFNMLFEISLLSLFWSVQKR